MRHRGSGAAFEVAGEGPHTVLLLHNWFGSARAWGSVPRYLDLRAFRYVYVEARGYGRRRDEDGERTIAAFAADALSVADELGAERFSVVGHSMGGTAALRVVADAPERVRAVVGISPVGATPTPFNDAAWALFRGAAQRADKRAEVIDLQSSHRNSQAWVETVVKHSETSTTPAALLDYLQSWAGADFAGELAGCPVPALAMTGEFDTGITARVLDKTWVAALPQCRVEILANAGHYSPDELPVQVATIMESFLAQH